MHDGIDGLLLSERRERPSTSHGKDTVLILSKGNYRRIQITRGKSDYIIYMKEKYYSIAHSCAIQHKV